MAATLVARALLLPLLRLLYKWLWICSLYSSDSLSCLLFLEGVFSFVRWGFLLFGVASDAVIPWILVLILFIGFPFGLDGSVLYTINLRFSMYIL